jgi:hypothetical protein
MKRFGSNKEVPRSEVVKELHQPKETLPQEVLSSAQCISSECKHHHEAVRLKQVLESSLKEGNQMMLESSSIINNMKLEYEKIHSILVEENDILRKELMDVKSKLLQANEMNNKEIEEISSKLDQAEKLIEDSQKKEPKREDVFTRLSRTTRKPKSNG